LKNKFLRQGEHYQQNIEIDSPIESSMAPRKCTIIVMTMVICGIVIVSLLAGTLKWKWSCY